MRFDGRRPAFERRALGVAVANGPAYGGGIRIAPRALLDDGLFDVCLVGRPASQARLLALLPRLYSGTHAGHHGGGVLPLSRVACRAAGSDGSPAARRMVSARRDSRVPSASRRVETVVRHGPGFVNLVTAAAVESTLCRRAPLARVQQLPDRRCIRDA